MKNHNMRELEKHWAEQRKQAAKKAAKAAVKKAEPEAAKTDSEKTPGK